MSADRFSVVGCRECDTVWIVEHLRQQDTAECPTCGHTRETDLLRALAGADDWAVACEQRARILADRAGHADAYADADDYATQGDRIDTSLRSTLPGETGGSGRFLDVFGDEAADYTHWIDKRRDVLASEAQAHLDRRYDFPLDAGCDTDADADAPDRSLDGLAVDGASLTPTLQADVTAPTRLVADCSPADFWHRLATTDGFQDALVDAVRDLLAGVPAARRATTLHEAGVTAADGGYARVLAALDAPPEDDRHQEALDLVAGIGQDGATILGHRPIEDVAGGPLAVLSAAETVPTIAVHVGVAFRELRPTHRETLLWLLDALGRVADVRLAMTGLTARWLRAKHGEMLPSSFTDRLDAHWGDHGGSPDIQACIDQAFRELDFDGRPVLLLRDLAAEPGEAAEHADLVERYDVGSSQISQDFSTLSDLGLASPSGGTGQCELLEAGSAFLDALDEEIGRQQKLDEAFNGVCKPDNDRRVDTRTRSPPPAPEGGEGAEAGEVDGDGSGGEDGADADDTGGADDASSRNRCPRLHVLDWRDTPEHATVAAAAPDGGLGVLDSPLDLLPDRAAPLASYNDQKAELVVGAEYDNPMSWMASTALALVNPRTFGRVDLADRVTDPEYPFHELFSVGETILRHSRCLGWFDGSIDTPEDYLDALLDGREQLLNMTGNLADGDYGGSEAAYRGEILRLAHGLAGTAVHLYDLVDVDVVRYLRVPRFGQFDDDNRADLYRVLATHATITSRYGQCTAYRALIETREDKRDQAIYPDIDASDPFGHLLGGITVVGPGVESMADDLATYLTDPREIVDDAPEFSVPLTVKTPDRTTYAEAVQRVLSEKNLRLTREATTMLRALTGSPFDAAKAVNYLSSEDGRAIRISEVRLALGHLDASALLPEMPPTVGKMLRTLLRTNELFTQKGLAIAADISRRSVCNHLSKLEALGLVQEIDEEYRLALAFDTPEERGQGIVSERLADDDTDAADLLFDLVLAFVDADDAGRLGDSEDPLGQTFYRPPDFDGLVDELPAVEPWLAVAKALCDDPGPEPYVVQYGPDVEQTALDGGQLTASPRPDAADFSGNQMGPSPPGGPT